MDTNMRPVRTDKAMLIKLMDSTVRGNPQVGSVHLLLNSNMSCGLTLDTFKWLHEHITNEGQLSFLTCPVCIEKSKELIMPEKKEQAIFNYQIDDTYSYQIDDNTHVTTFFHHGNPVSRDHINNITQALAVSLHEKSLALATGYFDADGVEIRIGSIMRRPVDCNEELHGSWAEYEVIAKGSVPFLSYLRSETGEVIPRGYLGCALTECYNPKLTHMVKDTARLRPVEHMVVVGHVASPVQLLTKSAVCVPKGLHPSTRDAVINAANSLMAKLETAQKKHGLDNGWSQPPTGVEVDDTNGRFFLTTAGVIEGLKAHLAKGDIMDSMAYLVFLSQMEEEDKLPQLAEAFRK